MTSPEVGTEVPLVTLAVSVGRARRRAFAPGRAVVTAIGKQPVGGRVRSATLGLEGDEQADRQGHGGPHRAVLVYDVRHYPYWQDRLGLADLPPGAFGENLTVRGLPEDEVCIGDRYAVGTALLEVSQPRVTCYRLGLHLGVPELPRLFVETRRTGFYCRVLREGSVAAGDVWRLVHRDEARLGVAEVDGLLYSSDRPAGRLRVAAGVRALSPGWRDSLADLLDAAASGTATDAAGRDLRSWPGWRDVTVAALEPAGREAVHVWLAPADGLPLPDYDPGQAVAVRVPVDPGRALVRSWTLSDRPRPDRWRITVKKAGDASRWLHGSARVGTSLQITAPSGTTTAAALAPGGPLVLFGAGVGLTPAMATVEHLLAAGAGSREVTVVAVARTPADEPFRERLATLRRAAPPWLRVVVAHTRPHGDGDDGGLPDHDVTGRLDDEGLRRLLDVTDAGRDATWILCGPVALTSAVTALLEQRGTTPRQVHTHPFGGQRSRPPAGLAAAAVTFARSGVEAAFEPAATPTLLDLAEAQGVPVRWSCRAGVCHLCRTDVLEGRVRWLADVPDAPPPGSALLCSAVPDGDVVLDI